MKQKGIRTALCAGVLVAMATPVQAVVYDFDYQVWGNSSIALVHAAGRQLFVDVTEDATSAANDVLFTFTNAIPYAESRIVNLYFDMGAHTDLFATMAIQEQSAGVSLSMPGNRPNMDIGPAFDNAFTEDYTAGRISSNVSSINGINPGEHLVLKATLGTGKSFADVIAAMNTGIDDNQVTARTGLRISEIIHRIWGEQADDEHGAFVTANLIPVPEADTWGMMLAGLGLVGFGVRRKTNR
jgi:hypothetical protein